MRDLKIEKSRARNWYSLPERVRDRCKDVLEAIAGTEKVTNHPKVKMMDGTHKTIYRARVGEYRVIFTTYRGELRVWRAGNRNGVYEGINTTYDRVSV